MLALQSIEDKLQALKMRREEERRLGAAVDKLQRQAEAAESGGCWAGPLCRLVSWARNKSQPMAHGAVQLAAVGAAGAASASRAAGRAAGFAAGKTVGTAESLGTRVATTSAIFGQRKAKMDPATKLAEAAAVMEARVEELEGRVGEQRGEAARMMKLGQKNAAMRALKKSKALEKQLASNQASLLAVEQQVDMLSQAHLQRTMADALHASSKGLKKDKKMLKKAEGAVEEAQEARDLADDLGQVMAEFATTGGGYEDDEDLLAELQEMAAADDGGGSDGGTVEAAEDPEAAAQQREMEALAAKHEAYDQAERVRQGLPSAPHNGLNGVNGHSRAKREEKAGLLQVG